MFGFLARLIGGPIVSGLIRAYKAKLDANNEYGHMAADLASKDIIADIEAKRGAREIRLATAGFWEMRVLSFLIALPFVLHLWAVSLDTIFALGWGIPKFPSPFDEWEGTILLSFFGIYAGSSALKSFAAAMARRR